MIDDLIDFFAEKKCDNCIYGDIESDYAFCNYKGQCIMKSGWKPTAEYLKIIQEQIKTSFLNAREIIDYEKEIKKIHKAMQEILIIKHEKYRHSWKYTSIGYLRERIKKIYKKLEDCWKNNNIDEERRLINIANQSMLLYLRLKQE